MAPRPTHRNTSDDDDDDRSSDEDFEVTAINLDHSEDSEDDVPTLIPARITDSTPNTTAPSGNQRARGFQRPVPAHRLNTPRKRAAPDASLDSGDEVTIQEGKKKNKKRKKNDKQDASATQTSDIEDDDEGGEGGWVKTRAQRRAEGKESRPLATTQGATEDIDAIMQRLEALPVMPQEYDKGAQTSKTRALEEADYITIKRTTHFAGKTETQEKRVLKDSAEARLHLAYQKKQEEKGKQKAVTVVEQEPTDGNELLKPPIRRPTLKPSRFDPNPAILYYPAPWRSNYHQLVGGSVTEVHKQNMPPPRLPTATKLNTVDKSRLDWVGYVDKAGISQELDEYGKSKQSYMQRKDFLNRTENRIEDERRDARRKPMIPPV